MAFQKRTYSIIGLIVLNIVLDQVSKIIVRKDVIPFSETQILGDYFILTNVENAGAFLGMGSDLNPTLKTILLLILPVIVLGMVTYHVFKDKQLDRWSLIGFTCIIGGGIANVLDRFRFGSVTDFLHIDLGSVFKTGIFNVADMSVTAGLLILVTASLVYGKKKSVDVKNSGDN
ncbi:MAG: signal peptidase II [Flavobacteriaceae bacterium]|nr:signal peptidase II [Bacteroidia bacterium]MBT8286394.1 signal peptidase II [Bacteroidia bacterium]NNF76065.1 signal peptidase II [Flavobacteriaceae bacterium]NNK74140.1 signal peptidase II [Flavobacteriaceae bacterium]